MKITINRKIEKESFRPKSCTLGLDSIELATNYGWNTEFIGYLNPLKTKDDITYLFYIEKIIRENNIGTIHVLNSTKEDERQIIRLALKNDYGLDENEFSFQDL